jgi:ribosomal protein S18 acetylase RimI-like enzyme
VEGLDDAMLDVNINNPEAQRLYDRLGFQTVARRIVYTKSVPLPERR